MAGSLLKIHPWRTALTSSFKQRHLSSNSIFTEKKIRVLDLDINYIETKGSSVNVPSIFFMPGAFGSIEMDFKPIIPALNTERYKWIAWDPPGYGKSRPPKRDFFSDKYECVSIPDVKYCTELARVLGYQSYTLLAWSGGAVTAVIMAVQYPELVAGLISWGAASYLPTEFVPVNEEMRKAGLSGIAEKRRAQLLAMYGEELLLEMWDGWINENIRLSTGKSLHFKGIGEFASLLQQVQCPSLIMHGMKDNLIRYSQAEEIATAIRNARLHLIESGTHNLHLRNTKEFVQCIQNFVDTDVIPLQACRDSNKKD